MMQQPIITVIVPVYNAENYLRSCVNSILNQTFPSIEILLIDDGSTDTSGAICDELEAKDHRIRSFHQLNKGVSAARNKGLAEARGAWIYFADSDDELYPDSLEYLFQLATQKEGTDFVIAECTKYDVDGKIIYQLEEDDFEKELDLQEALKMMYQPIHGYQGYLFTKLFKRSIIEKNQLKFNVSIYYNEDRLFCTQYICQTKGSVRYSTKSVYKYFEREGGAMNSIRNSFNYRFVTDFHAYILMSKSIHEHQDTSKWIRNLSKDETIVAYRSFRRRMKKFNIQDKQLKRELKRDLKESISLPYYMKYRVKKSFRKIKRKVSEMHFFFC